MNIFGMKGLGDNIYQRCFIPPGEVLLETPWPQLYRDMPGVRFIRCATSLRTQAKNVAALSNVEYHSARGLAKRVMYNDEGMHAGMTKTLGPVQRPLSLPDFGPSPISGNYVLFRPATVRSEWRADSRNPRPEYLVEAVDAVREQGLTVVSVADLMPGAEWLAGDMPEVDIMLHQGELDLEQLMAVTAGAAGAIGGVGWLLPAAMAYNVPAWIIFGGYGAYNAPELLYHPDFGPHKVEMVTPDNLCRCKGRKHGCDKTITRHGERVRRWAANLAAAVRGRSPHG